MTDVKYTHEFSTNDTSSVIDHVFYDEAQQILVVQLHRTDWYGDQVRASYADVPVSVYNQLAEINRQRLETDNDAFSVGSYWNVYIKPHYTGVSVDEISKAAPVVEDKSAPQVIQGSVSVAPAEEEEEIFILHFSSTDTPEGELGNIPIRASDEDVAIEAFHEIADIAGWEDFEVRAITRIFV